MKGHYLFVICFVLLSCENFAQNKEIWKEVVEERTTEHPESPPKIFLDIDFVGDINIYDLPNGEVVSTIRNNADEENFVLFDLLQKNDSMFYVAAYYSLDDDFIAKGWVFKCKHFVVYDRMYNPEKYPLILYEKPNDTSRIICKKMYYTIGAHEVIDFSGKWLKVKVIINRKMYEGWLSPEMQCCNVYSTCN